MHSRGDRNRPRQAFQLMYTAGMDIFVVRRYETRWGPASWVWGQAVARVQTLAPSGGSIPSPATGPLPALSRTGRGAANGSSRYGTSVMGWRVDRSPRQSDPLANNQRTRGGESICVDATIAGWTCARRRSPTSPLSPRRSRAEMRRSRTSRRASSSPSRFRPRRSPANRLYPGLASIAHGRAIAPSGKGGSNPTPCNSNEREALGGSA